MESMDVLDPTMAPHRIVPVRRLLVLDHDLLLSARAYVRAFDVAIVVETESMRSRVREEHSCLYVSLLRPGIVHGVESAAMTHVLEDASADPVH